MNLSRPRRSAFFAALAAVALTATACSSVSDAASPPSDCTPTKEFSTKESGTLSIVGPDYPPLFQYDGTAMSGVDGDVLQGFAEENCLGVAVTVLPAAGVIEAVKGGQADVAAGGWYPTEERAQVVNQSEPAYGDPTVLVAKDASSSLDDYEGKLIGTTQGYLWVEDLQKWGGDNVKLYQSPDAVFQDLTSGRIDVALMAVNEAAYRLKQSPDSGLDYKVIEPTPAIEATMNPSVTNFPATKGNDELTAAINDYLTKIRENGELADILEKHGIDPAAAKPDMS